MNLTAETLMLAWGKRITPERAIICAPFALAACEAYDINTVPRVAMFLAQVGHETNGLLWVRELWGPTAQQQRYEPPSALATTLGNTQPGDGKRYMGHGWIQVTGRANHAQARDRLRAKFPKAKVPDFVARPEDLCLPQWGSLSAGDFWQRNNLNEGADHEDIEFVTKRINGGLTGINERLALYNQCTPACALTLGI